MEKTIISKLKPGAKEVCVHGWVDTIRDQKALAFIVIRDRSGKVQVTVKKDTAPEAAKAIEGLSNESTVIITGKVIDAPQVKLGGIEIHPSKIEVTSIAKPMPIDEGSSVDLLMDYRWIDLRNDKKREWFEVQTVALNAMREYFNNEGFIEIMSPKITETASEGGAEVFEVKYFNRKAYMTQSPQLFKQMGVSAGFERVFEICPNWRAEKSFTSRHATEFYSVDIEMGFIRDEHDVMDVQEGMLRHVFKRVLEKYPNLDLSIPKTRFPRITLLESYDLLKRERNYEVPKAGKGDLDPEGERLLCEIAREKWGSDFIHIINFPSSARAFYNMRCKDTPKITHGFDLLYRGVEISSGAQREHDPERLKKNMVEKGINPDDMQFYTQFFEYGCPPHGGWSIGLSRLFAKMLGVPSVRDMTFLFRGPDRLAP